MRWFGDRISSFWDMSVSESVPGRIRWLSIKIEGYQIVQSLFAIGTGGWFGMGLCQGSPEKYSGRKKVILIFSAICEELGGIFAICLILVCTSIFSDDRYYCTKDQESVYKLIALGLGTEYAFQVFLTIGGATKVYSNDRSYTSAGELRRQFCHVYHPDACDHSGTVYSEGR